MEKIQAIRGFKDYLFLEADKFEQIISIAKKIACSYGFSAGFFPVLEQKNIFIRSLGDSSDIVNKEIYEFIDKSGNEVVLRPEFTAQLVRSFISNNLDHKLPLKIFTYGPLFRYERPQRGRMRQFHQLNYEIYGLDSAICDVEILNTARSLLKSLGLLEQTTLLVNFLGNESSRQQYSLALQNYLHKFQSDLSDDSKKRLKVNPLRILDSKNKKDQEILIDAPKLDNYLDDESLQRKQDVLEKFALLGIKYEYSHRLVRGLDYYNDLVFEFTSSELGAQATLLAGGRYNSLIKNMGGKPTSAIGFAAGIERIAELVKLKTENLDRIGVLPYSVNENMASLKLSEFLRSEHESSVEIYELPKNIGKRIDKAQKMGINKIIVVGENEIAENKVILKDLKNSTSTEIYYNFTS